MIEINNKKNCIFANDVDEVEYLNSNNIVKVTDNELLNHALHYAKLGYPVIPLHYVIINKDFKRCSCSDWKTCDKPGKHPRTWHGHKDATTNEHQVTKWWTKCPNANIGITTGINTGIFVLDIDVKYDGESYFEEMKEYYRCEMKDNYDCEGTLESYTGSLGRHLVFTHPMNFKINSSTSVISYGLDIKGEESYIVAPPSNHWSGRKYLWHGVDTPITVAPNWLMYEILMSQHNAIPDKPKSSKLIFSEKIAVRRNEFLSAQARGLVNSFSEKDGLRILLKKNKERLIEPLHEKEVERIVRKTWKKFGKSQNGEMGLKE